jgi:hypothetical protein
MRLFIDNPSCLALQSLTETSTEDIKWADKNGICPVLANLLTHNLKTYICEIQSILYANTKQCVTFMQYTVVLSSFGVLQFRMSKVNSVMPALCIFCGCHELLNTQG